MRKILYKSERELCESWWMSSRDAAAGWNLRVWSTSTLWIVLLVLTKSDLTSCHLSHLTRRWQSVWQGLKMSFYSLSFHGKWFTNGDDSSCTTGPTYARWLTYAINSRLHHTVQDFLVPTTEIHHAGSELGVLGEQKVHTLALVFSFSACFNCKTFGVGNIQEACLGNHSLEHPLSKTVSYKAMGEEWIPLCARRASFSMTVKTFSLSSCASLIHQQQYWLWLSAPSCISSDCPGHWSWPIGADFQEGAL